MDVLLHWVGPTDWSSQALSNLKQKHSMRCIEGLRPSQVHQRLISADLNHWVPVKTSLINVLTLLVGAAWVSSVRSTGLAQGDRHSREPARESRRRYCWGSQGSWKYGCDSPLRAVLGKSQASCWVWLTTKILKAVAPFVTFPCRKSESGDRSLK